MDIMSSYFLVVNREILAFTCEPYSINALLDLLFKKYNKIDLYDSGTCWYTATRKNVWEYLNSHEGRIDFICDPQYQDQPLDILIFHMGFRSDLDEDYENDKAILDFLNNKKNEEQLKREYENYQLRWMLNYGYSLNDLINKLGEIADEQLYNNGRFSLSENFEEAFEIFQEDNGFEVDFKEDELASFEQWKKGKTNSSLIFPF